MIFSLSRRRKSAPSRGSSTGTSTGPSTGTSTGACPYLSGDLASAAPVQGAPVTPYVDRREAERFVRQFHHEQPSAGDMTGRLRAVLAEIDRTGTYEHTPGELAFGARVAWRNAARCIGRDTIGRGHGHDDGPRRESR